MNKLHRFCMRTLVAACTILTMAPCHAGYKLQPGDVVEVSVVGLPDFRQKSVVAASGDVTLPMIASLNIGGLDLAEAQRLVKAQLSRKLYQQRGPDGRESVTAISEDAVTLMIAEYRPVFVNGDVTRPGQQSYQPGLTVRQAVALAGGYEIMRFRMENPFLESADLRNEYQKMWSSFVQQKSKIWRLKTLLGQLPSGPEGRALLDKETEAPLAMEALDRQRTLAVQQLQSDQTRLGEEKRYLEAAVKTANNQIQLLEDRKSKDEENREADRDEYEKLKDLSKRGTINMVRVSDSRRLFLYSSTQALQTTVQLVTTVRDRDEAQRKISRLSEAYAANQLRELEQAVVALSAAKSKLQAVGEKLTYTGMIRSQLKRGNGSKPDLKIVHSASNGGRTEDASEDSELHPGDTIEVALHTETPGASNSETPATSAAEEKNPG